jgi:RNA polymerase sigma-70 factor (ECF subfamily)
MADVSRAVADAFKEHRRLLWGIAYRMTGSAADADDVLQETFTRAVEHPHAGDALPLRPWLVHVAMNVARDALRRRKRRGYVGPWLPSPIPDLEGVADVEPALSALAVPAADARYDLRESASYAFLVALEALQPQQRAVLLMRDVLDYSVRETADALGLSEPNVKTTHHRARRAMAAYDARRRPSMTEVAAETRAALERFLGAIMAQDAAAAGACLADGVRLVSDGGGEYRAALRPVLGPDRVTRFLLGLNKKLGVPPRFDVRLLNGVPALVMEYEERPAPRVSIAKHWAKRFVVRCDIDARGAIVEVHIVVASAKLGFLEFGVHAAH